MLIVCVILDVGDYPTDHTYILCTASQHVPESISLALTDIGEFNGIKVSQMLSKVVKVLDKATQTSRYDLDGDIPMIDTDSEPEEEDPDSQDEEHEGLVWSPQSPRRHANAGIDPAFLRPEDRSVVLALNDRIRRDLRAVKTAGFRVGHLGILMNNGQDAFVTVSCRVAKLGISEEALQAWNLDPCKYFLLIIRYTAGYRSMERLMADETFGAKTTEIRVGLSQSYKIQLGQAIDAFSHSRGGSKETESSELQDGQTLKDRGLDPLFIARPLEELINDRLIALLRYRTDQGLPWGGAEEFYNDHQGRNVQAVDASDAKYWAPDDSNLAKSLPALVTSDHLTQCTSECSFPLLAMQFALRHLVRCTEFCLVCHCRVEADFEALKPYVCSKPLCLYQYMALGFGPSIEHEIVSQPHVVDLLVSFCYSSSYHHKLSSLPIGMGLSVPQPSLMPNWAPPSDRNSYMPFPPLGAKIPAVDLGHTTVQQPPSMALASATPTKRSVRLDLVKLELIFPPGVKTLRVGQWIYLTVKSASEERFHCRVIEAMHPTVRLGTPVLRTCVDRYVHRASVSVKDSRSFDGKSSSLPYQPPCNRPGLGSDFTPAATPPPGEISSQCDAEFIIYDQNFDDLSDWDKQYAICTLLETLPSVKQMKDFLQCKTGKDTSLRAWSDRISPAALGVLRWIIASNRSCIIQVDNINGDASKSEERVSGMPQWMQFRFAQGAPDKEQRFVMSVRQEANNLSYPTLFAWHGSPLHNWHGIVREGLHFQHTAHGRAFGNGVYHALDVATSIGYSGGLGRVHHQYSIEQQSINAGEWPQSQLRITDAVALNEIVNAPERFVSRSPHLVVAQLDWIQSRYLFVKCHLTEPVGQETPPTQAYAQDPTWTPLGVCWEKIIIPITAVSKSRRPVTKQIKNGNKRAKVHINGGLEYDDAIVLSDDTDVDDVIMLLSDDECLLPPQSQASQHVHNVPKTDFIPGALDHDMLPLLPPPAYATSMATRSLQRELNNTLQIQNSHSAHELGWYIDPELVENVYQWIVELHSFEPHLPLAKDLAAKGLKSVVLEIRFGKDYPISPPFVRVIRPRFLTFLAGGGGHVTAGGALCMELLTNSGWSAVSNIESVLLQVRLAISSTDPQPARLEQGRVGDYGAAEAVEAFLRACHAHGVSDHNFQARCETNGRKSGKSQKILDPRFPLQIDVVMDDIGL